MDRRRPRPRQGGHCQSAPSSRGIILFRRLQRPSRGRAARRLCRVAHLRLPRPPDLQRALRRRELRSSAAIRRRSFRRRRLLRCRPMGQMAFRPSPRPSLIFRRCPRRSRRVSPGSRVRLCQARKRVAGPRVARLRAGTQRRRQKSAKAGLPGDCRPTPASGVPGVTDQVRKINSYFGKRPRILALQILIENEVRIGRTMEPAVREQLRLQLPR